MQKLWDGRGFKWYIFLNDFFLMWLSYGWKDEWILNELTLPLKCASKIKVDEWALFFF